MSSKTLLIVGPNLTAVTNCTEIKNFYQEKEWLYLGDVQKNISLEHIKHVLEEQLNPDQVLGRIDVFTHGGDDPENPDYLGLAHNLYEDSIEISHFFRFLSEINKGKPLNLHLWSCFSGKALKYAKLLPEGSFLFTHVSPNFESINDLSSLSLLRSMKNYEPTAESNKTQIDILQKFLNNLGFEMLQGGGVAIKYQNEIYKTEFTPKITDVLNDPQGVLHQMAEDFCAALPLELKSSINIPDFSTQADVFKRGYLTEQCKNGAADEVLDALENFYDAQGAEAFKQFIEEGIGEWGPLHAAIKNIRVLEFLLEKEINPDLDNSNGTALSLASQEGDTEAVELMLRFGADPNKIGKNGLSLELSLMYDHIEAFKMLLNAGANFDYAESDIFFYATLIDPKELSLETLQFLVESEDASIQAEKYGFTELHRAILVEDLEKARSLIQENPEIINQSDKRGLTPLHMASRNGMHAVVSLLAKSVPNIDQTDNIRGETALYLAVNRQHKEVVQILLAEGADPLIEVQGRVILNCVKDIPKPICQEISQLLQDHINTQTNSIEHPNSISEDVQVEVAPSSHPVIGHTSQSDEIDLAGEAGNFNLGS